MSISTRPCTPSWACVSRPDSVACSSLTFSRLGLAAAWEAVTALAYASTAGFFGVGALDATAIQSSDGTSSFACKAGSCQPPFHWACSSALPLAEALNTDAGIPGRVCSQRSAWVASRPRTLNSPAPLVGRISPFNLACSPGADKVSLPWPPFWAGCTSSWPPSSASLVRTCRADSVKVPPACCAFQLPVALASRKRNCSRKLFWPEWVRGAGRLTALAAPRAVCTLASKRVMAPWPLTSARPSSGKGASWVCNWAGLICLRVAFSCHACSGAVGAAVAGAVAGGAGAHSPLASNSPPPSCALRLRTRAAPSRHSPWVSNCSIGKRC